jgi:hypothetical protein
MDPNLNPAATPQQKWEAFNDGVRAVFSRWTVLNLAVEHGFGGVYTVTLNEYSIQIYTRINQP